MCKNIQYPKAFKVFLFGLLGLVLGLNIVFPPEISRLKEVSPVVLDKDGQWISAYTVKGGTWRIAADLKQIDKRFLDRLLAYEDKRFHTHSGVDPLAVLRATRSVFREGDAVSGASTITMQLVRLLDPRPRTLTSKVIESFRALQLELFLSKTEILESYLTFAPYGGNIEGIEAASRTYFGKAPKRLTDAEIALLIALPQAPEARRPDIRQKGARTGRAKVLDKLARSGVISKIQALEANEAPMPKTRIALPELAWITGYGLAEPGKTTHTTLDKNLQSDLEVLTRNFVSNLDDTVNVAVTIVENKTLSVRAHIASADRARLGGWIDMTRQKRSPGSTLKPFVYGVAMDTGIISPASILNDAPTRFGQYQPENFNRRYHGKVRVFEALRHSLNVPAVAVLDKVGGQKFEDILVNLGIDITRRGGAEEQAGLALALGGAGLTVNDLAVLYAGIANEGRVSDLRWLRDAESQTRRMFLPKTARDISSILRQAPTPSGRVPNWLSENSPAIAYKTGTSYGFRDAWAAGYTDKWTVIVWVGRPDGGPRPGQTGRLVAAPLLFDIFSLQPNSFEINPFQQDPKAPEGIKRLNSDFDTAPQIIFPPDKAELFAARLGEKSRGFTLSARARTDKLRFFVDGRSIRSVNGRTVWRPESAGFYSVTAIDEEGRIARSNIEVITALP